MVERSALGNNRINQIVCAYYSGYCFMLQAGIGEMVHSSQIDAMNQFFSYYGKDAFYAGVYHGMFSEVSYAYIHPHDDMRATKGFSDIQQAFIYAYV